MPDIVVIGAGPAGLAAAARAAESGASVAMVDDNPRPGGQIWRASAYPKPWLREKVEHISGARVFAAPSPHTLSLETFDGERDITYKSLILATGARERFLPFPGWTLPNVMGAGSLQALAKSGLPIAGKKVVVAGSGPFLLAVQAPARCRRECLPHRRAGRFRRALSLWPRINRQARQVSPGRGLRAGLLGVRYLTGCWPVSAQGVEKSNPSPCGAGAGPGSSPAIISPAALASSLIWNWHRCSAAPRAPRAWPWMTISRLNSGRLLRRRNHRHRRPGPGIVGRGDCRLRRRRKAREADAQIFAARVRHRNSPMPWSAPSRRAPNCASWHRRQYV